MEATDIEVMIPSDSNIRKKDHEKCTGFKSMKNELKKKKDVGGKIQLGFCHNWRNSDCNPQTGRVHLAVYR